MLGVRRFDPSAGPSKAPTATPVASLRAAVEERQAKRRKLADAAEPVVVKSVSFAAEPDAVAPTPAPASDVPAAAPTPKAPVVRSKTQAKAHAKKQRRYKENRREAKAAAKAPDAAATIDAPATAPAAEPDAPVDDDERARRKAEKRAKREARRAATDAPVVQADEAEPVRPAHHDVLIQRAHASAKKTKRKRKGEATAVEPAVEPDHPNALPRFIRAEAPDAPSAELLDALAIAEDLREAVVIDEAQIFPVRAAAVFAADAAGRRARQA